MQIDNLTCTQRWVQYLRLLQESIWPGGVLPEAPKPLRTEEQKAEAEKQALQVLMGILPGEFPTLCNECIETSIVNYHFSQTCRQRTQMKIQKTTTVVYGLLCFT